MENPMNKWMIGGVYITPIFGSTPIFSSLGAPGAPLATIMYRLMDSVVAL